MKQVWRLYLDTSVFGGCFDTTEGWDVDSRRVLDYCVSGVATLVTSAEVEDELADAPARVRDLFKSIPTTQREDVPLNDEVEDLADAYLAAGVVGPRWREDCMHVAAATVTRAHAIISWNFKHIVRLDRIRAFNAVNFTEGYGMITILSPKEVNLDEQ
jgi:predicted nucleic acid-binding protein